MLVMVDGNVNVFIEVPVNVSSFISVTPSGISRVGISPE